MMQPSNPLCMALPLLARLCGGTALIADSFGKCLCAVDSKGLRLAALEGQTSPVSRAAGMSAEPQWQTDESSGLMRLAIPIGESVVEICNDGRVKRQVDLLETLKQTLPLICRVAGGEAVLFDRYGRRILSAGPASSELHAGSGEVSEACREVMCIGRPTIDASHSVPGAVAVRIPLTEEFGFGFNNGAAVRQKQRLLDQVRSASKAKYSWDDIIGQSPHIVQAIGHAKAAAQSDAPIFLAGESGTGKELFAQAIHNASLRHNSPFVAINCSALPENLVESVLFGYVEGTFTGASRGGRAGIFEQGNHGTLLLDEITEMPVEMQAKLLRVIQEKEVCRIGSVKPIPLDIRIIATTNSDLSLQIRDGCFRQDLYYRLHVIDIILPPLRERSQDIPLIVASFLDGMSRSGGRFIQKVDDEAMCWLMDQPWPGNVRELHNAVERAVSLASGDILCLHHFTGGKYHAWSPHTPQRVSFAAHVAEGSSSEGKPLSGRVANAEQAMILAALRRNQWHRGKTAAELGVSVTTLWRRMRRMTAADQAATKALIHLSVVSGRP
jgi:sigma-54 dependent transcriptional regulator, acetoin dehydrogenase operon transcriptional activator AcoR